MNTAVNRLIWQEYRSQRAIWLAVFAAVCLLLFMIRVNTQPVPLQYSVFMAICGGVAFAVLSLIVSFSGEVDNRTDVFLRMLPCSTRDLVTGRLLGCAVGAALFVPAVVCFIFALEVILLGFNLIWPAVIQFETDQRPFDGMTSTFGEDLAFALAFSFAVVSIAFAGSLLTRKVFTTILLVSVLVIVMFNLAFMIAHVMIGGGYTAGLSATQLAPWYAGTGMLVFVIALSLVGPWHRGQIPFSLRGRFSQSAEKPRSARSRWWPSYWTNAWLIRLAVKPASRSRVMRTLVWKELRSVVPFMPFAVLAMICGYAFDLNSITPPTFMVFVPLFVCFECGQRSLRDDQRSGTLRTLASMGLSPGTVWMAKTLVWLGTAIASISVILLLDFLLAWWAPADRSLWRPGSTPMLRFFVGTLYLDVLSAYGIAAIVAAFSVGQLAAAWIERQILAFAVGLLSMFFVVVLGAMFSDFGWSLWLTAVPISAVLFAIAGWTSTEWVEGRWSWRIVLRRTAMLVVPVVVCIALGWSWWRYEPQWVMSWLRGFPPFRQSINYQPSDKLIRQMDGSFWKEVTSARDEASPWNRFSRLLLSVESVPLSVARRDGRWPYQSFAGPESAENITKLLEPFGDLVSQSADAWPDVPVEMTSPWENSLSPLAIVGALIEDARLKTAAGQYQDAGRRLILAVKLARKIALQTASWDKWRTCLLAEQSALDHLRALTNAHSAELELPKLYGSLQESVLVKFDSDQRPIVLFPDPRPMLHRRTLYAGLLYGIDSNEDYRKSVSGRFPLRDYAGVPHLWLSGFHGSDIGRQVDLMSYSEMLVRMRLNDVPIGGSMLFDGRSIPIVEYHHQNHFRLLDRPALWDLLTDVEVLNRIPASNSAIIAMATAMANERSTLLTLLLQQHRKEHGSFPATLFDLNIDPVAQRLVRIDPFTGNAFFYAPSGVSKPVLLTPAAVKSEDQLQAPKNQPLLASAGPLGGLTMETATLPPKTEQDPLQWKFVKLPENAIVFLMYSTSQDDTLRDLPTFP
jgi:hypothetical protein